MVQMLTGRIEDIPPVHYRVVYQTSEWGRMELAIETGYDGLPYSDFETLEEAWLDAAGDGEALAIYDLDSGRMISTVARGGVA